MTAISNNAQDNPLLANFLSNFSHQLQLNPANVEIKRPAQPSSKLHPQPWCGNHERNEGDLAKKNAYNYGLTKEATDKTPMCRVAELARYNKLKHEYVLLDESGPAHKKSFTVKLVLKEGQEFQGSGASIKKAQQAAASIALDQTTLPLAPVRTKKKKDDFNPLILLHQVASRLNITFQCSEQTFQLPVQASASLNLPADLPSPPKLTSVLQSTQTSKSTGIPTYLPPPSLPLNNEKPPLLTSMPQLPCKWPFLSTPIGFTPLTLPPFAFLPPNNCNSLGIFCPPINSLYAGQSDPHNCRNNYIQNGNTSRPANFMMPMPPPVYPNGGYRQSNGSSKMFLNGSSQPSIYGLNGLKSVVSMPSNTQTVFKAVIRLGDGSEHINIGPNRLAAKRSAATKALFHLRPLLEKLDADLAASKDSLKVPTQAAEVDMHKNISQEDSPRELNSLVSNSTDSFDDGISSQTSNLSSSDSNSSLINKTHKNVKKKKCEVQNEMPLKKKKKNKSIISQIHERALRLKMNVEFEIVVEKGEPHNRKYTLCCRMTCPTNNDSPPIVAEGEGNSKKAAKQDACRKIFEKIKGIENDPLSLASMIVKNEKKQRFPCISKENKRKTIIKDKKMDPEYGHHINPVSRLIQVIQMQNQPEPVFKLLGEQGASRYKIFIIEVICLGFREEGTGPNKKLAKRAAAEAMLNQIGYVKAMPQPGKSLLKRKEGKKLAEETNYSHTVDIGVFDPNEFICLDSHYSSKEEVKSSFAAPNMAITFADVSASMETFTDVENCSQDTVSMSENNNYKPTAEQNGWGDPCEDFKADLAGDKSLNGSEDSPTLGSPGPIRSSGRRVTFSNEVSACPPPDDLNYPAASITPLKSEVLLVNKLKKRGRDSKKPLSMEEKKMLASVSRLYLSFVQDKNAVCTKTFVETFSTGSSEMDPLTLIKSIQSAKHFLDVMSKSHKFTVAYSDFPKNSSNEQCFSLVTLGLEKPIVSSGTGISEEVAHIDAAYNAIISLAQMDAS